MCIKVETPQITQLSQKEETRNTATSFPESPINITGMYTYERDLDEESARNWTYRSPEPDETGEICCGPSD